MCEKYNGWSNYPTWNVKLWIDNEEGIYYDIIEIAQSEWGKAEADDHFTREEIATIGLSKALQEWMNGYKEVVFNVNAQFGMLFDLLDWAIEMVDWHEIAKAYIEDNVDKDDDEEVDTDAED